MTQAKPKRLAVIGLPGSGKSTFSKKLGKILNLPVHHLDNHVFDGEERRDWLDFFLIKNALVNKNSWIIEGCSIRTLEMRYRRADTVIYLHLPRFVCIWRACKRAFTFDQRIAETGCLKGINWQLVKFIWNFDRDKREFIEQLRKKYPKVNFILFRRSYHADQYLEEIKLLSSTRNRKSNCARK